MPVKHTHEFVEKAYLKSDIKLLSTYVNALTKNDLECLDCSYKWEAAYGDFQNRNSGCPKCSGVLKHTHEFVEKAYLKSDIKLLSTYVNALTKNDLECLKLGHKWKATYSSFQSNNCGCPECFKLLNRGENHHRWNFQKADEERSRRNYSHKPENNKWIKAVYDRDNHTCQCCNIRGESLNAHHIDSWRDHKDDRFNVDNGVTLCETCHKAYHKACHKEWENEVNHNTFYLWIAEQSIIEPSKWSWVILYPESMNVWLKCFKR